MKSPGDDIAHLIARLRGKINDFITARLAGAGVPELSPSHGAIFMALFHEGPQTMAALSAKINRDKSTLTVLVRKLEALGYVKRESDPGDRRISMIHLTEKGFRFRLVFEGISEELIARIWGDAPVKERRRLTEELSRMIERV